MGFESVWGFRILGCPEGVARSDRFWEESCFFFTIALNIGMLQNLNVAVGLTNVPIQVTSTFTIRNNMLPEFFRNSFYCKPGGCTVSKKEFKKRERARHKMTLTRNRSCAGREGR